MSRRRLALAFAVSAWCLSALPAAGAGWAPETRLAMAREGARLAPPDLVRQVERHAGRYEAGVLAVTFPDDPAPLAGALGEEAERAVAMIREHRPFEEIVFQLGVVAAVVAAAHDPLVAADSDPREDEYAADFERYAASAEPRLPLVFYGFRPRFDQPRHLAALVEAALERGRGLYPLVGREYARIGHRSGVGRFDDRSTAFGVASLAFSHAASDVAEVLRYIWLRAGGADPRAPVLRGDTLVRLPRTAAPDRRRR